MTCLKVFRRFLPMRMHYQWGFCDQIIGRITAFWLVGCLKESFFSLCPDYHLFPPSAESKLFIIRLRKWINHFKFYVGMTMFHWKEKWSLLLSVFLCRLKFTADWKMSFAIVRTSRWVKAMCSLPRRRSWGSSRVPSWGGNVWWALICVGG